MPVLSQAQEAALNLGLLVMGLASLLATVWLGLQIIGWFKPKEIYATKAELKDLEGRLTGLDANINRLRDTVQEGFKDLERSIGRLEGGNAS